MFSAKFQEIVKVKFAGNSLKNVLTISQDFDYGRGQKAFEISTGSSLKLRPNLAAFFASLVTVNMLLEHTNGIMVWAWMLWSHRICSWNTNGIIWFGHMDALVITG